MKGSAIKSEVQRDEKVQTKNLDSNLIKNECKFRDKPLGKHQFTERTKGPPPLKNHLPPKTLKATPVTIVKRLVFYPFMIGS